MFGLRFKSQINTTPVKRKVEATEIRTLSHAGGYIRKVAQHSIKRSPVASPVGTPVHTRKGQIRRAIHYGTRRSPYTSVFVGPTFAGVGPSGRPHEHGGAFRGQTYKRRPYMTPALQKTLPRLAAFFRHSID